MSNSVAGNDNFLAKARKLSILPTSLGIFDIRQHYIRILYIYEPCSGIKGGLLQLRLCMISSKSSNESGECWLVGCLH